MNISNSVFIIFTGLMLISTSLYAAKPYGQQLCQEDSRYYCYKLKKGETWEKLFPDPIKRDIVKRVNRRSNAIYQGIVIAIPNDLENMTHFDAAPFPHRINPPGEKLVVVELKKLAWAAYEANGNLVHWGPISGGKGWCEDTGYHCRTATGRYRIERKGNYACVSSVFPLPFGGAAMPFCMHYYRAYALHGSFDVPGYHDSHGCVRMFINDARWLNQKFLNVGTKIIVTAD